MLTSAHNRRRSARSSRSLPGWSPVVFCLGLLALMLQRAWAIDQLELELGSLAAPGWRAEQLRFTLDWSDPATTYRLEIAELQLPALQHALQGVRIDCRRGAITTRRIACEAGRLVLPDPRLDEAEMGLSFELDRASGELSGRLKKVAVGGGRLDLDFQLDGDSWQLQASARGLKADALRTVWPPLEERLAGWDTSGDIDLDARLSGRGDRLLSARWTGQLAELSLGDAAGAYAGAGIGVSFSGKLAARTTGWRIESAWELEGGELLTPGFYLDAAAHPVTLAGVVELDGALTSLALQEVTLTQPGLLDLQLQGALRLDREQPLTRLQLRLAPIPAGELYREMLQPVLAGTAWGRFMLAGELDLSLDLQDAAMQAELGLQGFGLDDTDNGEALRRLGLHDVNGRLHWRSEGEPAASRLSWRDGHLLERIALGPGEIEFRMAGRHLNLTRQARVPVLDGALVVDRLDLQALGGEDQTLRFDGFIEPISMGALSEALGWLPLSGKLSGMLPGLKFDKGLLQVDGVLLVRIFDGDILIRELQLRDLFGVYPQLDADIELRNLDLEGLTNTFSFGRITGRLDGYVRDLRLEAWSPVAFDARFFTPEDDDSRRRISQKAVDNISNLGGAGMSGALARSFLRFFEEFSYKRIGIGCRLQNGVCDMTGAGEAKQGYYLVEGSGIPRIDIIGFNATADWNRLVEQLKQITTSGAPTVE